MYAYMTVHLKSELHHTEALLYPPKKLLWLDVSQMLSGQRVDPTSLF